MTQELPFDGVGVAPAKAGWREYLSSFVRTPGRARAALIGCLILMVVSPSGLSAMIPFVIPAFAIGTGISASTAILLFTTAPLIIGPIVLPFAGRWVDRIGARAIAIPAAVLYAVTTALVPLVSSNTAILGVVLVLVALFGFAATLAVVFRVVSAWFPDHRGMGFALIGAVSSLASAVLSPVFQWLINGSAAAPAAPGGAPAPGSAPPAAPPVAPEGVFLGIGWQGTYYLIALVIAVLAIPAAIWLISEPARARRVVTKGVPDTSGLPGFTLGKAVRTRAWIFIALFLAFAAAGPMAVRLNSVDFFGERGFDAATIALALSALFIASIIGLLVGGTVLDRASRPWVVVPMIAAVPAGLVISFFNHGNVPLLFIGTILLGFATGAESSLGPFLIARYFGLRSFAQIQGLTLAIATLSLGLAPFLISALSISLGSYTVPFTVLTALTFIAVVLAALIPKYPAPWAVPVPKTNAKDTANAKDKEPA